MSLEENKAIVRKMIEAINKQNLASLDEVMAPDFVLHMHAQQVQRWKVNKQVIEDEIKAFPDLHVAIEDIIAEGDKVCVSSRKSNTYRRIPWISPYGQEVIIYGCCHLASR